MRFGSVVLMSMCWLAPDWLAACTRSESPAAQNIVAGEGGSEAARHVKDVNGGRGSGWGGAIGAEHGGAPVSGGSDARPNGGTESAGGSDGSGGDPSTGGESAETGGELTRGGSSPRGGGSGTSRVSRGGSGAAGKAGRGGRGGSPGEADGGNSSGATALAAGTSGSGGSLLDGGNPAAAGATQDGGEATGGSEAVGTAGPPYAFPQNSRSEYCIYPSGAYSQDAKVAYAKWKSDLVTSDGAGGFRRVRRPDHSEGDTTVSEGIGYGMILAVFMDDPNLFDDLFQYAKSHFNGDGLMSWRVQPDNRVAPNDGGSATDADEDMAWALAQAAQKWGRRGSLDADYASLARSAIDRIWQCEVDHSTRHLVNAGDSWGATFAWNPSYFAPNQYRLFGKLTNNPDGWKAIIDKGYEVLSKSEDSATGLVPAWADANGAPAAAWDGGPTNYQYDAARVPFRIGMDYCDYGEPRAKSFLAKISGFFGGIGAANVVDGYDLNGTAHAEHTSPEGVQSALFLGAAAVGGMSDARFRPLVDEAYERLVNQPSELILPPSYYFNLSWKVFSLLMMSGNLFDYTLHP